MSPARLQTGGGSVEIGRTVRTGDLATNVHDVGTGRPVVLIHGSGPGVSAWANWRVVLPELARSHRVLAPDMAGFGYTECPPGCSFELETWVRQLVDLLDALEIERTSIVGNSFGGAVAIAFATRHRARVERLVLMGSAGIQFALTEALDAVWGYIPSPDAMARMLRYFVSDASIVTEELVQLRYAASIRPGVQEAFATMFPAPREQGIAMLATDPSEIGRLEHPVLVVHGREDQVVPWSVGRELFELLPNAELHVFGQCGHWTQIERGRDFIDVVAAFLARS